MNAVSLVAWIALGTLFGILALFFCWGLCIAAARGDEMGDWRNDEWPYDDDPPDPL